MSKKSFRLSKVKIDNALSFFFGEITRIEAIIESLDKKETYIRKQGWEIRLEIFKTAFKILTKEKERE